MEFWDPHFHIWDISSKTPSGHDPSVLFAPHGRKIYGIQDFEKDLDKFSIETRLESGKYSLNLELEVSRGTEANS